jgi:hypothetical protein
MEILVQSSDLVNFQTQTLKYKTTRSSLQAILAMKRRSSNDYLSWRWEVKKLTSKLSKSILSMQHIRLSAEAVLKTSTPQL